MISFTFTSIAEVVIARSALRHHLRNDRPSMLSHDHSAALRRLIDGAFSTLCVGMIPFVDSCDANAERDVLTLELRGGRERELRPALEAALVAYTLHLAYTGVDESFAAECLREFTALTERARCMCGGAGLGALKPCWY